MGRRRERRLRVVQIGSEKDFNCDQGRTQAEMFAPTPSTLSLKTMFAVRSHGRNTHPDRDYIASASDGHTALLRDDIDRAFSSILPEESEWCEDEVWKLHRALYGIFQCTETVAPTCCASLVKF